MAKKKRKKKRDRDAPMPAAGAGLIRFFQDETEGIRVGPLTVVLIAVAFAAAILIASFFLPIT